MGVFYFYGVFIYKKIKMAKTIKKSDLDKMYKIKKLIEYYCDVDVSKVKSSAEMQRWKSNSLFSRNGKDNFHIMSRR